MKIPKEYFRALLWLPATFVSGYTLYLILTDGFSLLTFVCIVAIAFGFQFAFVVLPDLIWRGIPELPRCEDGICEYKDYEFTRTSEAGWAYRCPCGNLYSKRGLRFYRIDPPKNLIPYQVWKPFRGWRPDSTRT